MKKTQYILSLIAALLSSVIIAQTEVGTLPGAVSVSPSGAATYTIPIDLPEGRAGMNPGLALTYNSQAGNGLLGIGWSLSGMSGITRTGTTIYHDGHIDGVDFDDNDQFALDGMRLIKVGESSGIVEYRTELETYSKIIAYGASEDNPDWFEVYTKDGRIMEYGREYDDNNARIEAQGGTNTKGLFWNLNRVRDRQNNYMDYSYFENLGMGLIKSIAYTGYSGSPSIAPSVTSL